MLWLVKSGAKSTPLACLFLFPSEICQPTRTMHMPEKLQFPVTSEAPFLQGHVHTRRHTQNQNYMRDMCVNIEHDKKKREETYLCNIYVHHREKKTNKHKIEKL